VAAAERRPGVVPRTRPVIRPSIGPRIRIVRASPAVARRQAAWIAAEEPWRGLGYRAPPLARYLARMGRAGSLWVALPAARPTPGGGAGPLGVVVVTDGFLLGGFIALLAVRPDASGQGIGRALVEHVAARVFAKRRWLFVSFDGNNLGAARFYRRLGFARVGRLPDLVAAGRVEILLRKPRPETADSTRSSP
jgi:ribosomal protein S18 acetylase RimI-like enzyme